MPRTNAICPNCRKRMKYLFELVYRNAVSQKGGKSNMWTPEKRALYCNNCNDIYRLELEAELSPLKNTINELNKTMDETTKKFKI